MHIPSSRKSRKTISRIVLGGTGFGIVLAGALGMYFFVRAVSPGSVNVPSFGPPAVDVKLAIECVTGSMRNGITLATEPSTLNATIDPTQVLERVANDELKCRDSNGWYMTGCSMFCSGGTANDESMRNANSCVGFCGTGTPTLYIRCCRYVP